MHFEVAMKMVFQFCMEKVQGKPQSKQKSELAAVK